MASGRRFRKSSSAAAIVGRIVVYTPVDWPGSAGAADSRLDGGGSNTRQPALAASAAAHTNRIPAKRLCALSVGSRSAFGALGTQAAEEINEVPHILVRDLALERDHLRIGPAAGLNKREDLAVGRPMVPVIVGQIRRIGVLGRERAVTLAGEAVAEGTVLLVDGRARRDRRRGGRDGILDRPAGRRAAGPGLGVGRECDDEHRRCQDNSAHEQSRYAT